MVNMSEPKNSKETCSAIEANTTVLAKRDIGNPAANLDQVIGHLKLAAAVLQSQQTTTLSARAEMKRRAISSSKTDSYRLLSNMDQLLKEYCYISN
ncbi:hypothetical protein Q1695_014513 [Nippostrongylus brasiliensis]|nr:hypothetical protein Q1695_014513 [Nippostrongylus brasiliensis]